jgi:ABC-type nitrate/sulfonate/bicarbonate transport system permease component
MPSQRIQRILYGLLSIGGVIAFWVWITTSGRVKPIILPPPADVLEGLIDIYRGYLNVPWYEHFRASLTVMLSGYFSAILIGMPLGIAMAWWRPLEILMTPLLTVLRPIPPPAWIPLAILWFGIGLAGKAFIVFVAAFVPVLLNSYLAIKETPHDLINAARSLGASQRTLLTEVAIPSGLPAIMAGLRIALGTSWATIVAAELVVAAAGFGFLIMNGYRNLESQIIMVGMIAVSVIGFLMNWCFLMLERRLVPWREDTHG